MANERQTRVGCNSYNTDLEPGDMVLMTNEGRYGFESSYPEFKAYEMETVKGEPLGRLVYPDRFKLARTENGTNPFSEWYG